MIIWIAPILLWLSNKAKDYVDFLRSIPNLVAPKPISLGNVYTPPFTGGQCPALYNVVHQLYKTNAQGVESLFFANSGNRTLQVQGNILGADVVYGTNTSSNGYESVTYRILNTAGAVVSASADGTGGTGIFSARIVIFSVNRVDGQPDSCGNLNNPIPPPPIPDDGLFNPTNPKIGDDNGNLNPAAIILAPALPLVLVGAIAAGYAAAVAAAKTATDILGGIQKLGEGLELLKDLFKKLAEDLDEKEKLKPKNRDIVRQTYGQIKGDGAIDFFPDNNTKFEPIQIDIIIVFIPNGYGKYFGSFSPHRYRYKELGYISFYSVNQGILETHSIQFKRTTLQIPPLAIGFIYHLGLDEQIRGFAFGTFSVEKS